MKAINIITAAFVALISGIGVSAAVENPADGTRVDFINRSGQRVWSQTINNNQTNQHLFNVVNSSDGWDVMTDQTSDENSYVHCVRFIPWGSESYDFDMESEVPTEYYVKSSKNRKPSPVKTKKEVNLNIQCGDTVVLVMELPDKAYPSIDLLYRYTGVLPDGEERWQETSAAPFREYSDGSIIRNPLLITGDDYDARRSQFINGSPSYTRLPDSDKCKNRWGYEFVMPNEPFTIKIGYDYADGKTLNSSVLTTLYRTLYTQFWDLDFNGNSGENWIMRYFGNGMSQEQVNNLTVINSDITSLSMLKRSDRVLSGIPWANYYCSIILSNMILDNLHKFDKASDTEISNARAQLLSLRAHCYTRILQIYGKRWQDSDNGAAMCAPLILDSKDIRMPLSSMIDIRNRIYEDLNTAIRIFGDNNFQRVDLLQPDLNVARGLKMRTALLTQDWITAKDMAQQVLAAVPLSTNEDILSGFYKRRKSWIWGASSNAVYDRLNTQIYYWSPQNYNSCNGAYSALWRVGAGAIDRDLWLRMPEKDIRRTLFAMPECIRNRYMSQLPLWYDPSYVNSDLFFTISGNISRPGELLADELRDKRPETNAFVHETSYTPIPFGAQLKFWSTGEAYGYDYNPNDNDATLFMRSDEALLTQAEACFMLGDESTARELINKLNVMRNCEASTSTGQDLLDEIRFTRRIELWGEGFGFFDQKRWNLPIKRNIWVAGNTNSGNWPVSQSPAAEVPVSASNGWRAAIPAYYVKQNPNIDIAKMGYTDVTGYTTAESAPPTIFPEMSRQAISKKQQNMIDISDTF